MNLILFPHKAETYHLEKNDPRVTHIREVLRMKSNDELFVGAVNGPRGKAKITDHHDGSMGLTVTWECMNEKLFPVSLLIGLPRPQTARKMLTELTALGVSRMIFFMSEKGEPSYAQSSLWKTDEWQQLLYLGAEQAFATHLPEVIMENDLKTMLDRLGGQTHLLALDNYEASGTLSDMTFNADDTVAIAIGSERGWSANERNILRENHFSLVHLGTRVLRAETAALVASGIVLSRLKCF